MFSKFIYNKKISEALSKLLTETVHSTIFMNMWCSIICLCHKTCQYVTDMVINTHTHTHFQLGSVSVEPANETVDFPVLEVDESNVHTSIQQLSCDWLTYWLLNHLRIKKCFRTVSPLPPSVPYYPVMVPHWAPPLVSRSNRISLLVHFCSRNGHMSLFPFVSLFNIDDGKRSFTNGCWELEWGEARFPGFVPHGADITLAQQNVITSAFGWEDPRVGHFRDHFEIWLEWPNYSPFSSVWQNETQTGPTSLVLGGVEVEMSASWWALVFQPLLLPVSHSVNISFLKHQDHSCTGK